MSIKIAVCVRTRDEENRIARYCEAYKDADMILVADGGSIDNTKNIAASYKNTIIRDFTERTLMQNNYWRNNDSAHANFLFDWAYSLKPDWIIYEDCDCLPNYLMRTRYRAIMEETDKDVIMVTRFYLWGLDKHFPELAKPGKAHVNYEPSLWAWRGNINLHTINIPPAYMFKIDDQTIRDFRIDTKALDLMPPYACLHYAWDTPERAAEKVKIYRESGLIPGMQHPLDFGGPLEDLPWFLHE